MRSSASPMLVNWSAGTLSGSAVRQSAKTVGQLPGLFRDEVARRSLDPETLVYRVQFWQPVPSGTEGGLFWGTTFLEPGKVGAEYFMTHGHFHRIRNRGERRSPCIVKITGKPGHFERRIDLEEQRLVLPIENVGMHPYALIRMLGATVILPRSIDVLVIAQTVSWTIASNDKKKVADP